MVKKYLLFGFIMTLAIIYFLKTNDIQTNSYKNKQAALRDNSIQRGWIPKIIPNSAYHIIETHNLDTNHINGSFKYLEKDEEKFISHLKSVNNRLMWEYFYFTINEKENIIYFTNEIKY